MAAKYLTYPLHDGPQVGWLLSAAQLFGDGHRSPDATFVHEGTCANQSTPAIPCG
ncbi:hypothetical protein HPP92_005321 [Vanilla planifolia]|uniref:Uncharacterized protein n=1 Tax=Vanilla planifolia TaxID=51239 RepID=A0A835RK17_VANPL|nr:hypothetical protein HPP92_005321 [Vanilla planifolia]